jgi:hypothetical protein
MSIAAPDPRAALLVRAFVAKLWPGSVQLDLGLPQAPPAVGEGEAVLFGVADAGLLSPAEAEFLAGFRQGGGHVPLLGLDARGTAAAAASPLLARASGPVVVHLPAPPSPLVADLLRRLPVPVVLLSHGATGWAESPWPDGPASSHPPLRVMMRLGADRARFTLWDLGPVPRWGAALAAGLALNLSARSFEAPVPGGGPGLMLEGSSWSAPATLLRATRLLHDGAYASEGDADYSWLWTGPQRQARLLLGALPEDIRMLRASIVDVGVPEALERLAVFLDGARVAHEVEWAEGRQRVLRLALPPGRMGWQVLGLGAGAMRSDDDGARQLGLCIDWVELRP